MQEGTGKATGPARDSISGGQSGRFAREAGLDGTILTDAAVSGGRGA